VNLSFMLTCIVLALLIIVWLFWDLHQDAKRQRDQFAAWRIEAERSRLKDAAIWKGYRREP
jgi:hypothetical protein